VKIKYSDMQNQLILNFTTQKSIWLLLIFNILISGKLNAQNCSYYQFKIYSIENNSQEARMDSFLKKAYLPALHRVGISKIGVFKPIGSDTIIAKRIWVLIPFRSLDEFDRLSEKLLMDKQFQIAGKDYIDAKYDNAPYKRIESILLKAFKGMPDLGIPNTETSSTERVYELRSYQGATEKYYERKVEMFNDGGEIDLFRRLDFCPVFFAQVISGATMPNLMYMTSFSNEAAQKEHWKSFSNHPDWNTMKELEKYKNTVSNIEVFMLHATDYSDL
jgi:hypothetical protein